MGLLKQESYVGRLLACHALHTLSLETVDTLLLLSAIDLVIFSLYVSYCIIIYLSDMIALNSNCMPLFYMPILHVQLGMQTHLTVVLYLVDVAEH